MNILNYEVFMMNSIHGAENGYDIIESLIQQHTQDRKEDKTFIQLEISSEISQTLVEKGFISTGVKDGDIEITPKGTKLMRIIESLNELLQT
jgi:predicted transcriptional regulator